MWTRERQDGRSVGLIIRSIVGAIDFFLAAVLAYARMLARNKQVRGLGDGLRDVVARVRSCSPPKDCLTFADQMIKDDC